VILALSSRPSCGWVGAEEARDRDAGHEGEYDVVSLPFAMSIKFQKDRSRVGSLEIGAKVCVVRGPFAGRIGMISKLDGKGGARVTLGLLSARVLLDDLGPFRALGRPSLKSSHRKLEPRAEGDVRADGGRSKKGRSPHGKPSP
jgi:hypothetical protein